MKRLVVCCDGTWKSSKDPYISNIEKIARAITTEAGDGATRTVQLVHYSNGVGTGAIWLDRVIGGAFGRGLAINLVDAYRFLALNYEPGDEIFVFGFSRGAYTARSLVGMIAKIGLVTADNLAIPPAGHTNLLDEALQLYQSTSLRGGKKADDERKRLDTFRACTYGSDDAGAAPRIKFIGVFDTVGALGAPGITRRRYRFLDVELSPAVDVARQALAIDERRLTFDPCVWTTNKNTTTDIKQVWFEGVHTDIGGGYQRCEPSLLTLGWMVAEASKHGLEFVPARLRLLPEAVDVLDDRFTPNISLNLAYRGINLLTIGVRRLRRQANRVSRFAGQVRLLEITDDPATPLYIAAPAYHRWQQFPGRAESAPNIGSYVDVVGRDALQGRIVSSPQSRTRSHQQLSPTTTA